MSLFTVDADKCTGCGACVAECPVKIIAMPEGTKLPALAQGGEDLCINCGHCVSVCPEAALALATMKPDDLPVVDSDKLLSTEEVEHFFRSRRSIRAFKKKEVSDETFQRLIEIARYAPTGHNMQPVEWLVIRDREEVKRLAGLVVDWMKIVIEKQPELAEMMHMSNIVLAWRFGIDVVLRDAPHMIVAHGPLLSPTAHMASIIAMTHLELAAPSLGLGGCWAGFFDAATQNYEPLKEALALPAGNISQCSMMIGYPKYKYHRMPLRNDPKIVWR